MSSTIAGSATPLVSIVIPCWNGQDCVGDAIESALGQTYPRTEVVVIDDGSTDNSIDVVRSFGERIRWETRANRGGCAARNRGVRIARGELIQFLDADDRLLPTKLEHQVPHALAAGPGLMSISLGTTNGASSYFDWQYGRIYESERDPVDFIVGGVLPTSAPIHFRCNLERVGGFDENLPCAQEFDLHLRLACTGLALSQISEVLFVVRNHPGSVSSDSLRVVRQKRFILGRAANLLRARNELTVARARKLGAALISAARNLEQNGLTEEARACREDGLALSPDAEILSWTPRWRPLVRLLGSARLDRLRRVVKGIRAGTG